MKKQTRWRQKDSPPPKPGHSITKWPIKWQRRILLRIALRCQEIPESLLTPIDYGFRPSSYWTIANLTQLFANIKGIERKKAALQLLRNGLLDEAPDSVCADSLSEELSALARKLSPWLLCGEYLPDYKADEVEIARVIVASTTQDVISIRAFPCDDRISYRAVDEYNSSCELKPATSKLPLSLRQLVRLIDTANRPQMGPIGLGIIQNLIDSRGWSESYAQFLDFSSEFYPDLSKHYWFAVRRFMDQNRNRRAAL